MAKKQAASSMDAVKAWAKREVSPRGGFKCTICTAPKAVRDTVRTVAEMRANGESMVSQGQLIDFLLAEYGVEFSKTTICNHVAHHLKLKWSPDGR